MNNAIFGKTMENVRNHVDVKLITKGTVQRGGNDRETEFSQRLCEKFDRRRNAQIRGEV